MYSLIIPAAGQSTRFGETGPKWKLTHPLNGLMLNQSFAKIDLSEVSWIYIALLEEHCKNFNKNEFLNLFSEALRSKIVFLELQNPTRNQPETVYQTIKRLDLGGPIFIKDVDNQFTLAPDSTDFVSVLDINKSKDISKLSSKSFITTDGKDNITNIVEKQIISNYICTGGYGFKEALEFVEYYEKLKDNENLYISHIIYNMILDGKNFKIKECNEYEDWGTLEEWRKYCQTFKTIFVDLDGTLVESSAQFFPPLWGTTQGLEKNIATINGLYDTGRVFIVITTSRKSSSSVETLQQINKLGIKYHQILYDLPHGQRILINDTAKTNPYPSAVAINLTRNNNNLGDYIQ
jgi:hypothetical protein